MRAQLVYSGGLIALSTASHDGVSLVSVLRNGSISFVTLLRGEMKPIHCP